MGNLRRYGFWIAPAAAGCIASIVCLSSAIRARELNSEKNITGELRQETVANTNDRASQNAELVAGASLKRTQRKRFTHFRNNKDAYIQGLVVGLVLAIFTTLATIISASQLENRSLERQESYQRSLVAEQAVLANVAFIRNVAVQEARTKPFRGLNLIGADLAGLRLDCRPQPPNSCESGTRADLDGSDLTDAVMYRIGLRGADLTEAVLVRADLERAGLDLTILRGADMSSARLEYANLAGADLTGANLENANLHGADLTGARLTRASLGGADIRGANFKTAVMDCLGHPVCETKP